jgi:hypothetical protein
MRVDTAAEAEALVGGANGLCAEALARVDATIVTPTAACSPESSRVSPPPPMEENVACEVCGRWILSSLKNQHYRVMHMICM